MNIESAARGFSAAGSAPRLEVLQALVRAGPNGLTVGQVRRKTGIPASTLAHHLRRLVDGELIEQDRAGRSVINRARFTQLRLLGDFLLEECCRDEN
jgi:DNA-binding transcriptional ArsR family regulator